MLTVGSMVSHDISLIYDADENEGLAIRQSKIVDGLKIKWLQPPYNDHCEVYTR